MSEPFPPFTAEELMLHRRPRHFATEVLGITLSEEESILWLCLSYVTPQAIRFILGPHRSPDELEGLLIKWDAYEATHLTPSKEGVSTLTYKTPEAQQAFVDEVARRLAGVGAAITIDMATLTPGIAFRDQVDGQTVETFYPVADPQREAELTAWMEKVKVAQAHAEANHAAKVARKAELNELTEEAGAPSVEEGNTDREAAIARVEALRKLKDPKEPS